MKFNLIWVCAGAAIFLLGCGGQEAPGTANLSGQVSAINATAKVNHYAASRFLDQASMGPSPAMVAQVKSQGIDTLPMRTHASL